MTQFLRKVRVALTLRNQLLKTRLSNGAIVYGKNRAGYGGRGIYIFRDAVEPEFEHLEKFLDSDGVFVDVGASTGIYTLKAAQHYRKNGDRQNGGIVLAIEPFPDVLAMLFHNIQANGFSNVRLRSFCAAERTGAATLWTNFDKPNLFSLVKRDDSATPLSTLAVTLDDLFTWEGLDRLDYLKIDVESAESLVLAGAQKIITQYRPIIQMEIIFAEAPFPLPDYAVFQAPGSHNKVYIPLEHAKIHLPAQLNWSRLSGPDEPH